jgi:hypothetical protein
LNIALYCDFLFNVGNGTQGFVNAEHTLSHWASPFLFHIRYSLESCIIVNFYVLLV